MAIDFLDLFKKRLEDGGGIIPTPTPRPDQPEGVSPLGASSGGLLSLFNGGGNDQHGSFVSRMFQSDPTKQDALSNALVSAGAGMMMAGAPSKDPAASSFLGSVGQGLALGNKTYTDYGKDQADADYKRALIGQAKAKQDQVAAQRKLVSSLFGGDTAGAGETTSAPVLETGSSSAHPSSDLAGTINAQRSKFEHLYTGLMQLGLGDDARPVFAQMNNLDNEMAKQGLVWDGGKYAAAPGYNAGLQASENAKASGRVAGEESQRKTDDQRNFEYGKDHPDFVSDSERAQQTADRAATQADFKNEQDLRKDYSASPVYKRYDTVRASFDRIQSGAQRNSGAGDLGVIYGYMKMLDPGSVVREGEFATAENASGVPTYVSNLYNKVLNGERLTEDQRKEFVGASRDLYKQESGKMGELNAQYTDIAKAHNIDPSKVLVEPKDYDPKPLAWPKVGETHQTEDGRTVRYRGGNPNDKNNWEPVM